MGVTIHYSFTLKDAALLKPLVEEVTDICKSMEWKFNIINEPLINSFTAFAQSKLRYKESDIAGLLFSPNPNCEPVWLTFLPNGRTSTIANVSFDEYTSEHEMLYWAFTKTQFAGADVHVAIVKLFKYLGNKYFETIEVEDEGGYWNTGDLNQLQKNIGFINVAISTLQEAIQQLPVIEGESINDLADRIEALLKNKLNNTDNDGQ